jgi:hypothetical protein
MRRDDFPIVFRLEQARSVQLEIGKDVPPESETCFMEFRYGEAVGVIVTNGFELPGGLLKKLSPLMDKIHYLYLQIYFAKQMAFARAAREKAEAERKAAEAERIAAEAVETVEPEAAEPEQITGAPRLLLVDGGAKNEEMVDTYVELVGAVGDEGTTETIAVKVHGAPPPEDMEAADFVRTYVSTIDFVRAEFITREEYIAEFGEGDGAEGLFYSEDPEDLRVNPGARI